MREKIATDSYNSVEKERWGQVFFSYFLRQLSVNPYTDNQAALAQHNMYCMYINRPVAPSSCRWFVGSSLVYPTHCTSKGAAD